MGLTSGLYQSGLGVQEAIVEAFDRIGVRPPEIGTHQLLSAKRSVNLILSELLVTGVNLWAVDLQTVPLVQGVGTYSTPNTTVDILDAWIRQYAMNGAVNLTLPAFSTTINRSTVTITWPSNGLLINEYLNIVIPISVGGLILYGFYQATSVLTPNTFTITAASNATATVTNGGVVPVFTMVKSSAIVNTFLPNHGLVGGSNFVVQVATSVGGTTLFGTYTVLTIVDANNFTFTAAYAAGFNNTATENSGMGQIAGQQSNQQPVDRIVSPISRTDYASIADKTQQGFPSVYWFDRLLSPTITLWDVPNGNGPYALMYYRAAQIQQANPQYNQTLDIPNRLYEAFCAQLAWKLATKWKPELEAARKEDAMASMAMALADDRERVGFFIQPDLEGYFN